MFFSHYDHRATTVVALVADGVADAAPGMPGRGKAWALYMKALTEVKPQSPSWLLPWILSFGNDSDSVLHPLFRLCGIRETLTEMRGTTYGRPPATALIFVFIGDYPACTATLTMLHANRQFPTTVGRIPRWMAPICWHCGIAPYELYNVALARQWRHLPHNHPDRAARLRQIESVIGLPLWATFYELVHAICVTAQHLLADIAHYYRHHADILHPVSAYLFILFTQDLWDIFLIQAFTRSKERRSRKPYCRAEPAMVMSWVCDDDKQVEFVSLLMLHPVRWDLESVGLGLHDHGPLLLWYLFQCWLCAAVHGNADDCEKYGGAMEDVWRVMLETSRPVPPEVPCAIDPAEHAPSFYVPVVGFGPASHTTLCSTPQFIRTIDEAVPQWRESGLTFLKYTAGICMEHGMKRVRSDVRDWGIATKLRRFRALECLQRMAERTVLRVVLPDFDPPLAPASATNRAYKDVPLSTRIDLERAFPAAYPEWVLEHLPDA